MGKLIFLLTASYLWGSSALAADPNWHTYSLKQVPKSAKGCAETANILGKKFEGVTGQEIFRSVCERDGSEGYDIQITYTSSSPLNFVSTINELGSSTPSGLFANREECLKALPQEIELFTRATGLEPFISYCFRKSSLNLTPYVARVDAWGDAKLHPYRYEGTVYASQIDNLSAVLKSVKETATASGISVHQASSAHDGVLKLVIRFYGLEKDKLARSGYFKLNELARYSSQGAANPIETCRKELSETSKAFSSNFETKGIFFCGWDKLLFEAKLYLLRIRRSDGIKRELMPNRYPNYASCEREKASVQAWYETKLGVKPFAILCTWKSGLGTGKPDALAMRVYTKTTFEEELPSWPELE